MSEEEYAVRAEGMKAKLYRTAFLYLGSETAAVDAVDEAVYQGLRAHKKLREPGFFATWLTRILINVCKGELRRRKRELREVVVLRYFTGLTLAETAQALSIPPGTVSTRQRRALALLRLDLCEEE